MEKTELAIRLAVDHAERNAQLNADSASVSFSAGGLDSDIASVDVDIAGHRIEQQDLDLVLTEGTRSLDPSNRTVLPANDRKRCVEAQGVSVRGYLGGRRRGDQ